MISFSSLEFSLLIFWRHSGQQALQVLRREQQVRVEPLTIAGVKAYMVTPENIPPENRNRLLIHVHGGCYVFWKCGQEANGTG
jgi:hypothetical protein